MRRLQHECTKHPVGPPVRVEADALLEQRYSPCCQDMIDQTGTQNERFQAIGREPFTVTIRVSTEKILVCDCLLAKCFLHLPNRLHFHRTVHRISSSRTDANRPCLLKRH